MAEVVFTAGAAGLPPAGVSRVLAVCGVSGGCGATTLALNLAAELAAPGRECLLVELARQAGTLANNLAVEPPRTVADLLADPAGLTPAAVRRATHPVSPVLGVLVGPYQALDPGRAGRPSWRHVLGLIAVCRRLAPLVILDVPCTFDDLLFETLALADRVLLVGVQTVSSLRTLQMLRETAERDEGVRRPLPVVNRYDPNVPGLDGPRLAGLLGVPRVWTVADDYPSVMTALHRGRPVREAVPHARLLADLRALALAAREEPSGEAEPPPAPAEATPAAPRRLRVLHVEDDVVQQMEMTFHLGAITDLDFRVTAVTSEAAAVEAFRRAAEGGGDGRFDAVLLDYHLAQGNGLGCLRQLRRLDDQVPILVISALSQPRVASELLEAGADDFVSKANLSAARLGVSLRSALARVEATCSRRGAPAGRGEALFERVRRVAAARGSAELRQSLHDLRAAGWPERQDVARIQRLVDLICGELRLPPEAAPPVATALFTLLLRLFGGETAGC